MPAPEDIAGIKNKLTSERAKLLEAFANLSRETLLKPFGDDGWSIKDLLAHVAMAEAVNVKFAKMMVTRETPVQLKELAADYPDFPGEFELDKFNAWMTERWRAQSLDEILSALDATRADTLAWLDTLTLAQLERAGAHAVWGDQSVRGMLRILVIHDKFHRGDIEKRSANL
ncbi:MAG: DinB family protein [Chloroflexi bacterium]|nr:DinB family protein [Chloroflexota bacterium]